ncbi:MAG: flagellar assembly protein FliW [Deltaproteobacteria bacterium]|nr:flagellar assembly protein FliW [Deltaproteobacteria bacterium]
MIIQTDRFGEIEVDEKLTIHFPDGLLGFPDHKDFVILEHKPQSPFCWLQSTDSPELAFVMTNPLLFKVDYIDGLSFDERVQLVNDNGTKNVIFSIVTIPPGHAENSTVNLLGPLSIDTLTRTGRQVILANSGYSHRHPLVIS